MKRPTMLTKALIQQCARDLDLSAERDVAAMQHRVEHEGFSFLAITLPFLSDALERGLEDGRFTCPSNFARNGRLPRFLGGFFNRVFDRMGDLQPEPCPYAIASIRQICRFWKKPKIDCSTEAYAKATGRFKDVEDELRRLTPRIQREDILLDSVSATLWSQVFPEIDSNSLVCCHGPGVTADRYRSNERYRIREWYTRSELSFPPDLHAYHNLWEAAGGEGDSDGVASIKFHDLGDEPGVRVVFVPKTMSGPRVIAIEPSAMQYMQQGLMRYVVPLLERHRLTSRSIRFTDQTRNQSLAHQSSIDRSLATLDLKDASDRVHLGLVQRIFKSSGIIHFLEDCRSLHADLPDGANLVLTKFASMGSAMCFPVEAMVFYTLVQTAMHRKLGWHPTARSIRKLSKRIDIYGDDIIVPVDLADAVVDELESYGLKVNVHKSFRHSHFRESCGGDFFNGVSVKPIYAREMPHDDRRLWTAETVMSWVSTADQFYLAGQWQMAQTIRDMLESVLRTRIPRSRVLTHGVGFASLIFDTDCRYRSDIQGWYQRRIVYTPLKQKDEINGDAAACFNRALGTTRAPVRFGMYFDNEVQEDPSWASTESDLTVDQGSLEDSSRDSRIESIPQNMGSDDSRSEEHPPLRYDELFSKLSSSVLGHDGERDHGLHPGLRLSLGLRRVRRSFLEVHQIVEDSLVKGDFEINFDSSVKRGAFKSKRRWVTVLT